MHLLIFNVLFQIDLFLITFNFMMFGWLENDPLKNSKDHWKTYLIYRSYTEAKY